MDELLTESHLQKYWQRQESLTTWTDSGYNSSNARENAGDTDQSAKLPIASATNGVSEKQKRKPWVLNAFAMTAPGHLAPGKHFFAIAKTNTCSLTSL